MKYLILHLIIIRDLPKDTVILEMHYQYATTVKYRTDITFGWLDLIGKFERIKFV